MKREQGHICFAAPVLLTTSGNNKELTADFMTIFMALMSPVGLSGHIDSYTNINRFLVARDITAAKAIHIDSRPAILDMSAVTLTAHDCLELARCRIKQIATQILCHCSHTLSYFIK
jgi:hypothetical protein